MEKKLQKREMEKVKKASPKWKRQRGTKTKMTIATKKVEADPRKRKLIEVKITSVTPMDIEPGDKKCKP